MIVQDDKGTPIPEVSVSVLSHTCWSADFTAGIGHYSKTSATLGLTNDEADRVFRKLWDDSDSHPGVTDSNGQATIRNLAGKKGSFVGASHQYFELPTSKRDPYHRSATVDLRPGEMSEIKLTLQRKGVEIIGK